MTSDELATYRAGVAAESAQNEEIIAAEVARILETQRAELLAKRAALIARGMKPYRAEVSDNHAKDNRRRAMLILERSPKAAIRQLTRMAYSCHEIAPWKGPLPEPITGQIK